MENWERVGRFRNRERERGGEECTGAHIVERKRNDLESWRRNDGVDSSWDFSPFVSSAVNFQRELLSDWYNTALKRTIKIYFSFSLFRYLFYFILCIRSPFYIYDSI